MRVGVLLLGLFVSLTCIAQAKQPHRWTKFVQVEGQPEPVPAEWVSTPEGQFAHSIKIPNPVPKDSGYRWTMSAKDYFEHLCKQEAGEFVFRSVENVDGLLFMRPPQMPTDHALMSRYALEAPNIERFFQLIPASTGNRSTIFVIPGVRMYRYMEEKGAHSNEFRLASGYEPGTPKPKNVERSQTRSSKYGLTWRGIKRQYDRENGIAGDEWIVVDLEKPDVLGVRRNYVRTGETRNTSEGIWWLNAIQCPSSKALFSPADIAQQIYEFAERVLKPSKEPSR